MDSDQLSVYNKMQKAALLAMVLFGLGLFGFSYLMNSNSPEPYSKDNRSQELAVWPTGASVQPHTNGVTLISFWAAWCGPCLEEIPEMQAFAKSFPEMTLQFVNTDLEESEKFKEAQSLDLIRTNTQVLSAFDPQHRLKNLLGLSGIPTHYLVGQDGSVLWKATGVIEWSQNSTKLVFQAFIDSEKQMVQEPTEN